MRAQRPPGSLSTQLNCPGKTINHVVSTTVSSSSMIHHIRLVITMLFCVVAFGPGSTICHICCHNFCQIVVTIFALLHLVLLLPLVTIGLHRCALVTNYSGEAGGGRVSATQHCGHSNTNTTLWSKTKTQHFGRSGHEIRNIAQYFWADISVHFTKARTHGFQQLFVCLIFIETIQC